MKTDMASEEVSIKIMQQTLATHKLEIIYERACQQVEKICESECARQLRLETLLLEDENEDLHTQLAHDDKRIDDLEQYVLDLRDETRDGAEKLYAVQGHLRIRSREIESLKAELDSLSGVSLDSTKLLTEKLTLARELSNIKPELDHLRSQATSYQSLLADKLSLQRQLSTLQVEVENEKRSTQRLAAKEIKVHVEDAKFEGRLEAMQAELTKERSDKQHADREAQKTSTILENKITTYESRLEAFRGKLRSTKDLLKETRAELQKAIAANVRAATTVVPSVPLSKTSRKRAASEIDADTMIGTPGDLNAAKKGKVKPTMLGEKSTFSITPFLNRTASVAPESPVQDENMSNNEEDTKTAPQSPSRPHKFGTLTQPLVTRMANTNSSRRAIAAPKLAQVAEEVEPLRVVNEVDAKVMNGEAVSRIIPIKGPETKKAKRKILGAGPGKTLFDGDDGDAPKGDRKIGVSRGFSKLGKGAVGLGGLKSDTGPIGGYENVVDLGTLRIKGLRIPKTPLGWAAFVRPSRAASSSSNRWQTRQAKDKFVKLAKVQGLKSRAAYKLLEINEKYKLFRDGQTVVDLGYAPGSWAQVAADRTSPNGRVVGIDIIPAQPPKGVSTLQGNFLSQAVQDEVKKFLRDSDRGRIKRERSFVAESDEDQMTEQDLEERSTSYLDLEQRANSEARVVGHGAALACSHDQAKKDLAGEKLVDVVLSDMSEPWAQTDGFWKRSLSDPYFRMMNASGNPFRDHAGSMDLCDAALRFAFDTLRTGGHLVCKFYQGGEDKAFEVRLKALFGKVHREKPDSSRSESREGFFVALRRKGDVEKILVFPDD